MENTIPKEKRRHTFFLIGIGLMVCISVAAIISAYTSFFRLTDENSDPIPLTVKSYEDTSAINPIDTGTLAEEGFLIPLRDKIINHLRSANDGANADSIESCGDDGFCIGGYAAKHNDQSICETHDFKSKYHFLPMCDCGISRGLAFGNSSFEDCYIGYGMIQKNEISCMGLPDVRRKMNVPLYEDDTDSARKIKRESCLYGSSLGKNNPDSCEIDGFFKDACYGNFAQLQKKTNLCDKVTDLDAKSHCIQRTAPLDGNVEKCGEIGDSTDSEPSYVTSNPSRKMIAATEERDRCFFDVVSKQNLTDTGICEKIEAPYFKYDCRQSVAENLKDPTLCTIDFLASQDRVDSCVYTLSKELGDMSLCQKSSNPGRCMMRY